MWCTDKKLQAEFIWDKLKDRSIIWFPFIKMVDVGDSV